MCFAVIKCYHCDGDLTPGHIKENQILLNHNEATHVLTNNFFIHKKHKVILLINQRECICMMAT